MMKIEKRSKILSLRVQPKLLNLAQNKLLEANKQKNKRERKTTISDVFEESLYALIENNKM